MRGFNFRSLSVCFMAFVLFVGAFAETSQAACKGRGRGRGRGRNAVAAAELRLQRDQLLLEQQALLLGVPRLNVNLGL